MSFAVEDSPHQPQLQAGSTPILEIRIWSIPYMRIGELGIMAAVFIKTNIQSKMIDKAPTIPCRRIY